MLKILIQILIVFIFSFADAVCSEDLICGIAEEFPPYQFKENGETSGFDAEVARLVFERLDEKFIFFQDQWDSVFNDLRYGKIDFVTGMEIIEIRKKLFDFTTPYSHRYDVVFIREDNKKIKTIEDLYNIIEMRQGQAIPGLTIQSRAGRLISVCTKTVDK